jgi:hypothetical protein
MAGLLRMNECKLFIFWVSTRARVALQSLLAGVLYPPTINYLIIIFNRYEIK